DRPVRNHEGRLAVRARRLHPLSGDERASPFSGGFRRPRRAPRAGAIGGPMSLIRETDYGTPASQAEQTVRLSIDGREVTVAAGAGGLREVRYGYAGESHLEDAKDESNPYFTYDPSKCIVCSRCVRACDEVQGTFALTISGRGFDSRVAAGVDEPFLGSECVS